MKRTLLTAIALYLLYDRQKRVEARLRLWKLTRDAELRENAELLQADLRRFSSEVVDDRTRLVKEITQAFKQRGARP